MSPQKKVSYKLLIFLIYCIFGTYQLIFGQENPLSDRILVISYAPFMHLSNADSLIAIENAMDTLQWRATLQKEMEKILLDGLSEYYTAISVYLSSHPEDKQLFHQWHTLGFCSYKEETPTRLQENQDLERNYVKFANWFKQNASFLQRNKLNLGENLKETKYTLVYPNRNTLLDSIGKIFKVEKILFLTKIEIINKFQFRHPEDFIPVCFVKLHFCLYNTKNELLHGDVAVSKASYTRKNINDFLNDHVKYLAYYIISSIQEK